MAANTPIRQLSSIVLRSSTRKLSIRPFSSTTNFQNFASGGNHHLHGSSSSHAHRFQQRPLSTDDEADANDLSSILQREINEEKVEQESLNIPEDLSELKTKLEKDYYIVEGEIGSKNDGSTVRLHKKTPLSNGSKVVIGFHCQDTLPFDDDEDDFDEEGEPAASVRFVVTVSKAGNIMVIKCLSEEADITIESLTVVKSDGGLDDIFTNGIDSNLYAGPEYSELALDLRLSLLAYVKKDCGINEDVAAFISMYADYREQVGYVNWLESVKLMVE